MKKAPFLFLALAVIILLSCTLPPDWIIAGMPDKYETCSENTDGKDVFNIKSKGNAADTTFGTIMQMIPGNEYYGKRIRMTGYIKTQNVSKWAGLWMRVDGPSGTGEILSFDNMEEKPVKGTNLRQKYAIVLDVPAYTGAIAFGGLLVGTGEMWFDDIQFEVVDKNVITTDMITDKEKEVYENRYGK